MSYSSWDHKESDMTEQLMHTNTHTDTQDSDKCVQSHHRVDENAGGSSHMCLDNPRGLRRGH